MPSRVMTETTASVTELKRNPIQVAASGDGQAVAILNRNTPAFYCIPADAYEALMDHLDDLELVQIVQERKNHSSIEVSIDEL